MVEDSVDRFWSKVDRGDPSECWEWTAASTKAGYGRFKLHGKLESPHRVVWELERGPIPDGLWVLHHCDNPACVNPAHLFLGTRSDNMRDAYQKGRCKPPYAQGSQTNNAKLTAADVRVIRARYALGESQAHIAQAFPVSRQQVCDIVHRKYWTHI